MPDRGEPRRNRRRIWAAAAGVMVVAGGAGLAGFTTDKSALTSGAIEMDRVNLGLTSNLFAIGVTDFDQDGLLDVFTVNHAFAPLYARNQGGMRFSRDDFVAAVGMDKGWITDDAPLRDQPGIYVYWQAGMLHLVAQGLELTEPADITLRLNGGILARSRGEVDIVAHGEQDTASLPTHIVLKISGEGALVVQSLQSALDNGYITLDPSFDLAQVFVGNARMRPQSHEFALHPGADRHGVAWVDLNGDGLPDAIHVDGGEIGTLNAPRPYEAAIGMADGLSDPVALLGLVQELCPSRQVALYDVDGDGRLDAHVVCGRSSPPRADHPHELFIQTAPMKFENRAAAHGFTLSGQGRVRWFDAGGTPAVLWAGQDSISVYHQQSQEFVQVFSVPRPGEKAQIAMGDINGDGWPDFYIASPRGASAVVRASADGYRLVEPADLGLPGRAECAAFVDHDNDGQQEFHSLPAGLFRQNADGGFSETGALASGDYPALCLWFDANNDGFQDLLVALPASATHGQRAINRAQRIYEGLRYRGQYRARVYQPLQWEMAIHRNQPNENGWLSVDLVGPPGNPVGLGAGITLAADGVTHRREAGAAEGATTSQGHYRSYFGFGPARTIDTLTVHWPDGTRQEILSPAINQHHVIHYSGDEAAGQAATR